MKTTVITEDNEQGRKAVMEAIRKDTPIVLWVPHEPGRHLYKSTLEKELKRSKVKAFWANYCADIPNSMFTGVYVPRIRFPHIWERDGKKKVSFMRSLHFKPDFKDLDFYDKFQHEHFARIREIETVEDLSKVMARQGIIDKYFTRLGRQFERHGDWDPMFCFDNGYEADELEALDKIMYEK